ncbi:DUF4878 domain-containing protein [Aggregatimonas sangjinii]|uniref:DUF4878 domain-containing protein n=1 Tax=Aggregatimonas sangjinii TaxID=2583587 RepID=A0A5B7SUU2_9FLAO|nr:DUF4878 domain-containing protein [Aggregatimonas sangjinii]QCX00600.1 DUF4878 domain-containing protein [Aggregatimonas sangjinii]
MKKLVIFTLALLFIACAETQDTTPASVAEIVAESFYQGDEATLKKYTTPEGFANFSNLMKMFAKPKSSEMNFKVIEESTEGDVAWVKYSTAYDKTPGIFKLVKVDGVWKATARKPKEEVPF